MWALAVRTLRHRRGGIAATFLALFLGAVTVTVCGGLLETGIRNNAPAQRLAAADLVVTGDRTVKSGEDSGVLPEQVPVDASLAGRVRAVDGVRDAVAERTFDAAVLRGGTTDVQGHGWESAALAPYRLTAGYAPRTDRDVVLDERSGAHAGERVRIAAHGGSAVYRVSGVVRGARHIQERAVFFSGERARELAGDIADIGIRAEPGTDRAGLRDRVERAVRGHHVEVVAGDDRGAVEYPEVAEQRTDLISIAGVFGGMATVVAVVVVSGTVSLNVQRRRREFALLRTIGATPRQVRRLLLAETFLVAVVAGAAAWPLGPLTGRRLFDAFTHTGLVSGAVDYRQGWIPAVSAAGALLLTALLGGWTGARHGATVKPAEAMADAELRQRWAHPVRIVSAVIFLAGATALAILTAVLFDGPIAASTAGPTVLCATIGLALIGPALTRLMTALLGGPVRWLTGAGGHLAVQTARSRTVRTAAVVTPVMLATGMAVGNLYLQTTQADATGSAYAANLRADAVVGSAAGGVDPALLREVRRTPGVAAASAYATGTAYIDGHTDEDGMPVQGVTASAASRTTAVREDLSRLTGDTVAISRGTARDLHKGIGDTVPMRLGDGTRVKLRVVALFPERAGYDTAFLPAGLLAAHTADGQPEQILVRAAAGTSRADLTASLRRLTTARPELTVADRDTLIEANAQDVQTQAWVNYLLVGMIVAYTAISVVNNLALSVGGRRRELGLQRLVGATRAQVLRAMTLEALFVAAIGLALGTAAAATALVPFSHAAAGSWLPSGPLWIYGATVAGLTGLVLGSTLLPTWAALRVRPAVAAAAAAE